MGFTKTNWFSVFMQKILNDFAEYSPFLNVIPNQLIIITLKLVR